MKSFRFLVLVAFLGINCILAVVSSTFLMDSEHNYDDTGSKGDSVKNNSSDSNVDVKERAVERKKMRADPKRLPSCTKALLFTSILPQCSEEDSGKGMTSTSSTTTTVTTAGNASSPSSPYTEENNSTELPSFSEWSQKALEEEERRRSEERKRKEELRRQHQLDQQEKQQLSPEETEKTLSHSESLEIPSNLHGGEGSSLEDSTKDNKDPSSTGATTSSQATNKGHSSSGESNYQVHSGKESNKMTGIKSSDRDVETTPPRNQRMLKNFASLDCGAKVVDSSSSSKGASNVLSSSKDEYLLSPCSEPTWFVVELCESMQALRLEVANFELYSGVPHHLRLSLSQNGHQWTEIGQFFARDEKGEQVFNLKKTNGENRRVFGKLAKLEVLDNHGSEHYCPISMFKLIGIAEIELIGDDEEDEDDNDGGTEGHNEDGIPTDKLKEGTEDVVDSTTASPKNLVTLFREKVDQTLERVVGIFTRSSRQSAEAFRTYMNQSSLVGRSLSREIVCPDCTEAQYNDVYFTLATNYTQLLQVNAVIKDKWARCVCPSFYRLQVTNVDSASLSSSCMNSGRMAAFFQTLFGSSRSLALCNVLAWERGLLNVARSPMLNDAMKSDDTTYKNVIRVVDKSEKSESISNGNDEVKDQKEGLERQSSPSETPEPKEVTLPSTLAPPDQNSGPNQQQSVWQKLSTKIKTLERNLTLSTGYLQELSLSYKQQIEDLQRSVRLGVENLETMQQKQEDARTESSKLRSDLEELAMAVNNIDANLETTAIWTLGIHLMCLFLEVVVGLCFIYGCFRGRQASRMLPSNTAPVRNGDPSRPGRVHHCTQLNGSLPTDSTQGHEAIEIADVKSSASDKFEEKRDDLVNNEVDLVVMQDQKLNDHVLLKMEKEDVEKIDDDDEELVLLLDNGSSEESISSESKGCARRTKINSYSFEVGSVMDDRIDNACYNEDNNQGEKDSIEGYSSDYEDERDLEKDLSSQVISPTNPNGSETSVVCDRRHHRSKSSSPPRIAQATLTKHVLRNFKPDQAEWMPPKQG